MILDLEIINELIETDELTLTLSPDVISVCFEKDAPSLFNLIQYSERNIKMSMQEKDNFTYNKQRSVGLEFFSS